MFNNQKKNFLKSKWFYGIIVIFLLVFGIWVNTGEKSHNVNTNAKVDQESRTAEQEPSVVDSLGEDTSEEQTEGSAEYTEQSGETQRTYYSIQEAEGVVKVFYHDETGRETLKQITSIPFQLLSKQDQQLLTEGVQVETEEQLASFLENFDS